MIDQEQIQAWNHPSTPQPPDSQVSSHVEGLSPADPKYTVLQY